VEKEKIMKFEISRTSLYGYSPHPDSHEEEYTYIDERTIPTLEEAKKLINEKNWCKKWFEEGTNHREILVKPSEYYPYTTMIARDLKHTRWVVDIDDLLKWINDLEEEVVISPKIYSKSTEPLIKIEIYDTYRE
jgi:hypothetical protein